MDHKEKLQQTAVGLAAGLGPAIGRVIAATVAPEDAGRWNETLKEIEAGRVVMLASIRFTNTQVEISATFVDKDEPDPLRGATLTKIEGAMALPVAAILQALKPRHNKLH